MTKIREQQITEALERFLERRSLDSEARQLAVMLRDTRAAMAELAETVQALEPVKDAWMTFREGAMPTSREPATVDLIRQRILDRLASMHPTELGRFDGGPSEGATLVDMYQRLGFGHPVGLDATAPTPVRVEPEPTRMHPKEIAALLAGLDGTSLRELELVHGIAVIRP